jgi:hypothetical protein
MAKRCIVADQSVRCFLRTSLAVGIGLLISAAIPATLRAEGNVTAVVTNGGLVIRGDAASNGLSLVLGDTAGTIAVGGFDGTTTVNGSLDGIIVSGVTGDVDITLRGGDDQLNLIDLAFVPIPGSLLIDTGPGDDAISVDDSSPGEDVVANTGPGNDSFTMNSGARNLLVHTADGDDFLNLDGVTVGDRATLRSGGGDDEVVINFSTIGGDTTVETSGGTDSLTILDSTFEGSTELNGGGGNSDRFTDEGLNEFNGSLTIANFEIIEVLPPPP